MLNWICPECGRENDPNLAECPCLTAPPPLVRKRTASLAQHSQPATALLEPVAPACALMVADPQPRLAPRIAATTGPVDLSVHGPALIAMLRAIRGEPKLLAPALEMKALGPALLCDLVPVPFGLPEPPVRVALVRQDLHPAPADPVTAIAAAPAVSIDPLPALSTALVAPGVSHPRDRGPAPRQPRALARPPRRLSFPSSVTNDSLFVCPRLCGQVPTARPSIDPRTWNTACRGPIGPIRRRTPMPSLPPALRRFQEAVVPRASGGKRIAPGEPAPRSRLILPAWVITVATAAAVLVVALFAMQHFGGSVQAHVIHPAAPASTQPAYGAWPSIDKFVEVTGLRLTTDQQPYSEAVFTVVNHSASNAGPTSIHITVPPAKPGDAPLCDFTANAPALGPWEAREMRVPLTIQLHASDLPDWHDLRPQVQVTAAP